MGSFNPDCFDIFEIYKTYCNIVSGNDHVSSKERLAMFSKTLDCIGLTSDLILRGLSELMSCLDFSVASRQFNCLYDFAFFICRKNGQKNITVQRAVAAWQIVLNGRFRLLNQWCNFVEGTRRHNISEDTWQQLLAFSRCVNEDLEGYDPKGAWPVLIDDFVDHMYSQSSNSQTLDSMCCSGDEETQPIISNTFGGLDLLPGSKRKYPVDARHWIELNRQENSVTSSHLVKLKRAKQDHLATRFGLNESNWDVSMSGGAADFHASAHKHNSLDCAHASACAIEDSLSKGFEGYLSIGSFQYEAYHADMHIPGSLSCVPTSACAIEDSLSKGFEGYLSIGSPFQYDQKHGVS
ncbi:uncharacterized protein LOC109721253 [Ananas comosus]|uniref:Defective in cullin neddylation protein n=1 Tax=Ananas comosus TaxID=4615 RepID=A0A6P5GG45_ANACO|nr:uncharacterized protein LOC109721253 [Ananas comosus]